MNYNPRDLEEGFRQSAPSSSSSEEGNQNMPEVKLEEPQPSVHQETDKKKKEELKSEEEVLVKIEEGEEVK